LNEKNEVKIDLGGFSAKNVSGEILTCKKITDKNTFEQPDVVKTEVFKGAKLSKGQLVVKLPAMSIVTLAVK
jgi:alpha-N-arabinofuranosidase